MPDLTSALAQQLTSGNAFERWVLESPWGVALALLAAGVVGAWTLNQRARARPALIALIAGALGAAAVIATGLLVETERERVIRLTGAFVDSVAASDAQQADALLDTRLIVLTTGNEVTGFGKGEVLAIVRGFDRFGLTNVQRTHGGAEVQGRFTARSRITVRVEGGPVGAPLGSTWELGWTKHSDGAWRIVRLEAITIAGRAPGSGWADEARRRTR